MGASAVLGPRVLYVGGKKGSIPQEVYDRFNVVKHITVDTDPSRITVPLRIDFVFLQTSYLSHKVEQKIRACIGNTPMIRINKGWNELREELEKHRINPASLKKLVEVPKVPTLFLPVDSNAPLPPLRKLHPRTHEYTELYRRWNPTMHHKLRELYRNDHATHAAFFTERGCLTRLALNTLRDWVEQTYRVVVSDAAIRKAYKKPFVGSTAPTVDPTEITKLRAELANEKELRAHDVRDLDTRYSNIIKQKEEENRQAWAEIERLTAQVDAVKNIVCPKPNNFNA